DEEGVGGPLCQRLGRTPGLDAAVVDPPRDRRDDAQEPDDSVAGNDSDRVRHEDGQVVDEVGAHTLPPVRIHRRWGIRCIRHYETFLRKWTAPSCRAAVTGIRTGAAGTASSGPPRRPRPSARGAVSPPARAAGPMPPRRPAPPAPGRPPPRAPPAGRREGWRPRRPPTR